MASKGFLSEYSKSVYVRLHSENFEPTFFFSNDAYEHPPTPPPTRRSALITLPTLAKLQVVWRRLCGVLIPSCLVKHGLTDALLLIEYYFYVTRIAPSILQLRSMGRPSLPSSALPRFVPRPFLPPVPPQSPFIRAVRDELQSKQLVCHFHLIQV